MSTSHSDVSVPTRSWGRIWLVGVVCAVGLLAALESMWRHLGYSPGLVGGVDLWALHRDRANAAGDRALALVGDSQIQVGFDQAWFRETHPELEISQLAVCGFSGEATIADLAHDPDFTGHVIWSVNENALHPARFNEQKIYVDHYRKEWSRDRKWSYLLKRPMEERFVLAGNEIGLVSVLEYAAQGRLPPINPEREWAGFRRDRSRWFEGLSYRLDQFGPARAKELQGLIQRWPPSSPAQWADIIDRVDTWVEALTDRGARMAIVKMPSSGPWRDRWACEYPHEKYWEVLTAALDVPVLRMRDLTGMEAVECIDEIHLASREARITTEVMIRELARRDFFR